ncbi:N-terminal phage integrase SAM-like domain-containing protein [Salibacterium salarium]|uniref:N-terminal phage integrase SAM-like domain-containing protein n=1 Tax=Salibacterium salarium TaxID=284579 RepID=UPI001FE3B188|nr:N-terminal phage integrase SAM-like domain-containing protein [Salibacterium salarium]
MSVTGKGSIEKRGRNSWRLRVNVGYKADGTPIRRTKTVHTKNKTEAYRELSKFTTEVEAGEYIAPEKMQFHAFIEEWRTKYAEKNLAATTLHNYILTINKRLLPEFGEKKLADIKTIHIVNYLNELRAPGKRTDGNKKPLSEASIQFNYRILKNIFAEQWNGSFLKKTQSQM